jgi:hypothetical protein
MTDCFSKQQKTVEEDAPFPKTANGVARYRAAFAFGLRNIAQAGEFQMGLTFSKLFVCL